LGGEFTTYTALKIGKVVLEGNLRQN
jgi:hypothetical protein